MDNDEKSFKFVNTYEWANIVSNVLYKNEDMHEMSDIFNVEDPAFIQIISKPCKTTLLHLLIDYIFEYYIDYATRKYEYELLKEDYEHILDEYGICYKKKDDFKGQDQWYEYVHDLEKLVLEKAKLFIVNEVFNLLFNNRVLLLDLNKQVSKVIKKIKRKKYPEILKKDGVLKRVEIPEWVKKAICFRDKNRCLFCKSDLSGTYYLRTNVSYDHIVPLEKGGANDPTNFQLLCNVCNGRKREVVIETSDKYMSFW